MLSSIVKGGTTYTYAHDSNGNVTTDGIRGMTITYNYLNLPKSVIKGTDNLEFICDATGVRLATKQNGTTQNYYTGAVVYKSDKTPDYILTSSGMIRKDGANYIRQYNITDHLGNVRSVVNQSGTVEQATDYYPYGLSFSNSNLTKNRYLYNGKEIQNQTLSSQFFGMYDYGARYYDPVIGRWMGVDPMAYYSKQNGTSPFAYSANNPIRYIDPTGMIWEDPKQAERLSKSITNRIESIEKNSVKIQAQIDKSGLTEKKIAKLEGKLDENSQKIELLNQSLSDIKSIGDADETYKLTGPSSSDGTYGVVKGTDGVIKIEGSNTGLHIHEMRHVGQSIKAGGVRFNKDGKLLNAATTKEGARNNEVNAYQVQYSYDGSYPAGANSLKDINGITLVQIKTEDGRIVYEKLKN